MSLINELKRISSQHNFRQSKRLSQSFLFDERVLVREAEYAALQDKVVLEIGPGFGFLTKRLASAGAKKVIAVEKDARLIPVLEREFVKFPNIEVVHSDFLEGSFKADVVVSNVPYAISSPLLFRLATMRFERAILCLQKEFVDRMLAKPGTKEYSRLSVTSQAVFKIRLLERVPRSAFYPQPKVDSALIEIIPTGEKLNEKTARLVLLLFQHRKKTLRAAISDAAEALGMTKEEARSIAEKSGFSARRVFTLTKEEIVTLASSSCAPHR